MHQLIQQKAADIAAVCRRFRVRRLEVFGSAARGEDFDPEHSDADFLVEFEDGAVPGLNGFFGLKEGLEQVLGRPVDLVSRKAVERSRNYIRRRHILRHVETVYMA